MTLEAFRYQYRKLMKDLPRVALIGIRGYNGVNEMGRYDDAIVRYIAGDIKLFPASVDPGKYYIDHPVNPQGCARLQCGLWQYQLGEHHARKALVQADEVTVDRLDQHGKRTHQETGYYGINVHSGGPEYLVGRFSAGCQVIHTNEVWKCQWLEFFDPIHATMLATGQKVVPYLLLDRLEAIPVADVAG